MNNYLYKRLGKILNDKDSLSKKEILNKLELLLPEPCKYYGVRCDTLDKFGKEIYSDAMYDAAETLYTLCSNCNNVIKYCY